MSKERAKRRAEREIAAAAGDAGQTREQAEAVLAARPGGPARREQRSTPTQSRPHSHPHHKGVAQPWWRRIFQPRHGRRRFSRRTRAQRAMVVFTVVAVLGLIWLLVDDWSVRIGLSLVAVVATPALVTMALGRSHR
ncbi:MAG: hypothetical protein WKF47_10100 [Geodermatophilaceae bacterium]|jgi:hypothetical protein